MFFFSKSADATWLSTNHGIIVCIECSGIHREMGVHISKIQSLTLDNIGTSQLLVARVMSNEGFNRVMEARAAEAKPGPGASMEERKAFIRAKYEERRFVRPQCSAPEEVFADLEAAVDAHNVFDLLQAASEAAAHGVDLTDPLPTSVRSFPSARKKGCREEHFAKPTFPPSTLCLCWTRRPPETNLVHLPLFCGKKQGNLTCRTGKIRFE